MERDRREHNRWNRTPGGHPTSLPSPPPSLLSHTYRALPTFTVAFGPAAHGHSIPRSPGLVEKLCHDIAHRPPHVLSQLHRPLLVFTFLSRSFVGIPMFHIYLVGALCVPVHVASRRRSRLDLGESGNLIFHIHVCVENLGHRPFSSQSYR